MSITSVATRFWSKGRKVVWAATLLLAIMTSGDMGSLPCEYHSSSLERREQTPQHRTWSGVAYRISVVVFAKQDSNERGSRYYRGFSSRLLDSIMIDIVVWCEMGVYCSFAYSALACFRMGISGSASFHSVRKFWYAALAFSASPDIA